MKYFGTDGFRGEANVTLTVEHAFKVGRFLGYYYNRQKKEKAGIVIGKDTRRSSYMLSLIHIQMCIRDSAWSTSNRQYTSEPSVLDSVSDMDIHGVFFNPSTKTFGDIQEITQTKPYSYTCLLYTSRCV